jgi:hypothetical protein
MDEQRLYNIEHRLDNIDETLYKQHISLTAHMKRSDALEEQVKPMHNLMLELRGAVKFFKLISVLAGVAEAVRMFWH